MVEQTKMVEMEEGGIIIRQLTSKKDLRREAGDQEMTQIYLKHTHTHKKKKKKKIERRE